MSDHAPVVIVTLGGDVVFTRDQRGEVFAPIFPPDRAVVAAALAQASAALGVGPPPSPLDSMCVALTSGLSAIGTPEALALMGQVADRVRDTAAAVNAAAAMIGAHMPTAH